MGYRAAVDFIDLQDDNRLYHAGDTFPRDGLTVSDERIAELAGNGNRMGYPLIEQVEEKKPTRKRVKKSDNPDS